MATSSFSVPQATAAYTALMQEWENLIDFLERSTDGDYGKVSRMGGDADYDLLGYSYSMRPRLVRSVAAPCLLEWGLYKLDNEGIERTVKVWYLAIGGVVYRKAGAVKEQVLGAISNLRPTNLLAEFADAVVKDGAFEPEAPLDMA